MHYILSPIAHIIVSLFPGRQWKHSPRITSRAADKLPVLIPSLGTKNLFGTFRVFGASLALLVGLQTGFSQPSESEPAGTEKSPLVRKLENRFYSEDFVKIPQQEFRVNDFGAVGDDNTDNTLAIQKAIDAAAGKGGGVITFAPGTYKSGAIFLKSNIELRLDKEVTIKAIQKQELYPRLPTRIAGVEMDWPAGLVNIYEQQNVRITGPGIIDGNGKFWWDKFRAMEPEYNKRKLRWLLDYDCERVRGLVVWKSSSIHLRNFQLHRQGFWGVQIVYCQDVHVDGAIIRANIGGMGPSTDGIDVDSSSDVLIENCDIDCHDDIFCMKAGKNADGLRVNRPTENVVVRNSIGRTGHGLIVLGSETSGGLRNIEFYNIQGKGTLAGIRFKSARTRGGIVENIKFSNVVMEGVRKPFEFDLDWLPAYSNPVMPDGFPPDEITDRMRLLSIPIVPVEKGFPQFRNITIENVQASGAIQAFHVVGMKERPMQNITFNNVRIQADKAGSIRHAENWQFSNCEFEIADGSKILIDGKPLKPEN
jgi:hypothetical protein